MKLNLEFTDNPTIAQVFDNDSDGSIYNSMTFSVIARACESYDAMPKRPIDYSNDGKVEMSSFMGFNRILNKGGLMLGYLYTPVYKIKIGRDLFETSNYQTFIHATLCANSYKRATKFTRLPYELEDVTPNIKLTFPVMALYHDQLIKAIPDLARI